ncbi:MAG: pgi, glucose-6-phosphate isomerase [Candidatus Saccharibacteria bacterium]|nr:pgi, glucose-6-phosphate isomerase [Candidatus Saccharibacteria bacterium]
MTDILDNINVLSQRDPEGALEIVASQYQQAAFETEVLNAEHDTREITSLIVTGMGGSALAALVIKVLLQSKLKIPFDIIRGYDLPGYVNENTLVIASSYSGNTEETLSALEQAQVNQAQLAIIASGGKLIDIAKEKDVAYVQLPSGVQPRMAMLYNLRGVLSLLETFGIINDELNNEVKALSSWLETETAKWTPDVALEQNYAKQLAHTAIGKTPIFYGGAVTAPLAYKWKISWNETAKNTAWWNEYSEFNHNEFMGWASHPVEKPFVVFDILSSFERPRILQRFELTDKLLSGKRPAANTIQLQGDTLLAQLLWGAILADFASTYAAVLNGVDPTPVVLIEKLKQELADDPR